MKKMHQIIKELREDHDLTQKQVADMIGTNQSYYSTYESGEHALSVDALWILADYYKVSLDYITGRNYDRFEKEPVEDFFIDKCTYKELNEMISFFSRPARRALLEHIELLKLKEEKNGKTANKTPG